jgi:hypothetical protein
MRVQPLHRPLSLISSGPGMGTGGALGQGSSSVCSGPVPQRHFWLGIKPEQGQILLAKHKGPSSEMKVLTSPGCHCQVSWSYNGNA